MKKLIIACLIFPAGLCFGQKAQPDSSIKSILLKQLKETHDKTEWFVPLHAAIQDLTPAQASWKPDDSSHSIVQLVSHLLFWNTRGLSLFNGKREVFKGSNDETFANLQPAAWAAIVHRVDSLSAAWEKAIAEHPGALTAEQIETITHMSTHNAYHIGQIMYVRKQEGAWNAAKGVH